jgi:hypothetical protein
MSYWRTYKSLVGEELAICFLPDGTVVSGLASAIPEYQAWLAEGNEPEEWAPEEVDE